MHANTDFGDFGPLNAEWRCITRKWRFPDPVFVFTTQSHLGSNDRVDCVNIDEKEWCIVNWCLHGFVDQGFGFVEQPPREMKGFVDVAKNRLKTNETGQAAKVSISIKDFPYQAERQGQLEPMLRRTCL
jgi:hypothetical protein